LHHNGVTVEGPPSEGRGIDPDPEFDFPDANLYYTANAFGQGTDIADTFYSEACGVDLMDTAVFPKIRLFSDTLYCLFSFIRGGPAILASPASTSSSMLTM
jgi:hypothetical protein